MPCSHPKVIHVTDCNSNYEATGVFHLCQICGSGLIEKAQKAPQQQPPPQQSVLPPIIKGFLDLLAMAMANKMKGMAVVPVQQPPQPPPHAVTIQGQHYVPAPKLPVKQPCPNCGCTLHDIATTSRLGCPQCYEHFKEELMPVFVHAHKAIEHVGKKPKRGPKLSLEEEIKLLELQLTQAIEHEQYERAKEIKDKLDKLKQEGHD
jgi:protein-arginine kinase activator protein McsA